MLQIISWNLFKLRILFWTDKFIRVLHNFTLLCNVMKTMKKTKAIIEKKKDSSLDKALYIFKIFVN